MTGPILILQNLSGDGPGYLGTWLAERRIRAIVLNAERGDHYPESIDGYVGLALLGGEMSANDDLPHLRQAERLILQAMAADIPVIGHCLGGQLMARALGARVRTSPQPEIGWQSITVAESDVAHAWLGGPGVRTVYHWHSESFGLPPGAERLAGNDACPNQAFAIGRHLAMQFHVELDEFKLAAWSASVDPAYVRQTHEHPGTVQTGAAMRAGARAALPAQQCMADRLYRRWLGISD
jgi:GMP synthase-like glutamine amidotransferase